MIRELLDLSWLEDLLGGFCRASRWRSCAYDSQGQLVCASDACNPIGAVSGSVLGAIPPGLRLQALVPADAPPAEIAFLPHRGLWYVVAPVYVEERLGGFAAIGEFREGSLTSADQAALLERMKISAAELDLHWQKLEGLQRRGDWPPVQAARWLARMLSDACRRESQITSSSEELALVGDLAELLHGGEDLQKALNRILAETARVMKCQFCSLRLLDPATGELKLAAVHNLSQAYLSKGQIFHEQSPIDREALQGRVIYIEDAGLDSRMQYPEEARREGIVSGLTAGLLYRGQPVGVMRVYTNYRHRFRGPQRKLLRAISFQVAAAIVHARLFSERLEAARTQRQLELAGDLQMRLMRTTPPVKPAVRTASIFQPSALVGGDYCDFFLLADGRLACVVADVVGKALKASLLSTYLRGALRAVAASTSELAALLEALNRQFFRDTLPSEFVTLLIVAVAEDGRSLEYCNAGHEPLLRLRGRQIVASEQAGLVLGVDAGERYEAATLDLRPDDLCLLYTDGAIEAANFSGQLYGRERLSKALLQHGKLELSTALRGIQWDIRRFVGMAEQADDLTLVGLRVVQ